MDGAYEGNETQRLSRSLGYDPVVPPNPNRLEPWEYDETLYKKRNEIERLFKRRHGILHGSRTGHFARCRLDDGRKC